ncbi:monovalent cation/H(+) antiporter subunit G [Halarchaeum sp. P4]|uniref:monovalent cation/H(+) antiporter subunit G n=1 Tax=Halarchaeum sp. P4 TaxID=3421639 RepID=UPI003EBA8D5C
MTSTLGVALVALLGLGSVFFTLVAAVGVVRLPDVYARAHATSKSDTLGTGLGLAAGALALGFTLDSGVALFKVVLLTAFVLVANPVAAHAIVRAAHLDDVPTAGEADETEGDAT